MEARIDPLPTEPDAGGEPKNGEAFVIENQIDERRGFERLSLAGENISRHGEFSFLEHF